MIISADQLSRGSQVVINPQGDRSRKLLIEGVVKELLTRSNTHPHGILVRLESGETGRVKTLLQQPKDTPNSAALQPSLGSSDISEELVLPVWLASDNPYLLRDLTVLKAKLNKKYDVEAWREVYHNGGICGALQEITKLLEKSVESIFKLPLFLIGEDPNILVAIYGRSSNQLQTYKFVSSTDLISKLQFLFNDRRKKDNLVDMANYIDSDIGLLFDRIARLDNAAITSLNSIRNYRNYLSHPQNNVLSQSKTRFIVDYALVDFKEIYDLDVHLR